VDLHVPWEELAGPEAMERYAGVAHHGPSDLERLPAVVRARGLGDPRSWQEAFSVLLALAVEPHLGRGRPTILHSYPAGLAAQARPLAGAPWLADQFELWVEGVELGNSYAEITDPGAQAARFEAEARRLASEGRSPPALDEAYLEALGRLPRDCAGGSVGLDRTLMLFLGAASIDQVRLG
jgi:lysyl-tRNA synthetase class 2